MSQTKLKAEQLSDPIWYYRSGVSTQHDYSSLGTGQQEISDGSSNFQISVTLDHASDVLIEWGCIHFTNNTYGAGGYLYRDSSVIQQSNFFRHGQEIANYYSGAFYIDENRPAGTYIYKLKAAASGSVNTVVTYRSRFIKATLIDI